MKLWNLIKEQMLERPKQAFCKDATTMTFEETVMWAEIFAKKLHGVTTCAILCSSEIDTAMAILACLAAEVTAIPLSMRYEESSCHSILDTVSPDAIIMDTAQTITVYKCVSGLPICI